MSCGKEIKKSREERFESTLGLPIETAWRVFDRKTGRTLADFSDEEDARDYRNRSLDRYPHLDLDVERVKRFRARGGKVE